MKNIRKRIISFVSALAIAATGTITLSNSSLSMSANAADINYGDALKLSLYMFDGNKCGTEVSDHALTWRGNCHTYDATASLDSAQGLSASSKAAIQASNGGSNTVDVSGGYHDAGDHLKFSVTMGFSAASLGWSYFSYPDSYKETGSEAHLLEILKNTADYFMKVTYLDSSDEVVTFCYMVGDGGDHSVWSAPETQTMTRPTYWSDSSHPSADAAGEMSAALSTISLAFADKNATYSAECLKYAKALYNFAKKYPTATYDGVGSYYSSGSQKDDVIWAETWLELAENGGKLPSNYTPTYKPEGGKKWSSGDYDGWVYSWDKVYGGVSALMTELGVSDSSYKSDLSEELSGLGGLSTSAYKADGWGATRYNCAKQMYALKLAAATNNSDYNAQAKYQMDFILGNNPSGTSFLIGYGDKWPTKIHHRAANVGTGTAEDNSDATYTLYGALVGGPDSSGNYEDNKNSYSCTEPALDYNGCFALAIAGLYSVYGGSTKSADAKIQSASEINSDYVFSYGDSTPAQEETTEAPTETTTEELTGEMTLDSKPSKLVYKAGEELDLSGLAVTVKFSDGTSEEMHMSADESVNADDFVIDSSSFDNTKTGSYTITVKPSDSLTSKCNISDSVTFEVAVDADNIVTSSIGDVNEDGGVTIADLVLLQKYLIKKETLTQSRFTNADINLDQKVNSIDLACLKQVLNTNK